MDLYGQFYRHAWLPFFDGVLKGRRTLQHWLAFEESQWWPRERLEEFQLRALQALLMHSHETSPYYREMWQQSDLHPQEIRTFADFEQVPLLTREIIREHRTELRSTAPLNLFSKSTGGSSGVPLHFDLDTGSNDRRTALMYRGYRWGHGEPGTKQLFIWGGSLSSLPPWKKRKTALHNWLDRKTILNCFDFTPEMMPRHLDRLNASRPDVIIAYTNPLYEFARYLHQTGREAWSPRGIIVGAEKLHSFQRELIQQVFHAPVFETYGSREFMLIGAECEHHTGLHLSMENLYVEILTDEGHPAAPGEEGNVVITDLFNYGMPFIRYVNGDRAVAGWDMCPCGRGLSMMKQVTGRRLDVLVTPDGKRVPGEFFPHLFKDFDEIQRFQVVQERPEAFLIKLVAPQLSSDRETQLLQFIREGTGTVVQLELQKVSEIPLTRVGKLQVVLNKLPQESIPQPTPVGAH
ncbi:MAG: phenylacetate--CoA ligase family protein [Planctomycetales bacterium]